MRANPLKAYKTRAFVKRHCALKCPYRPLSATNPARPSPPPVSPPSAPPPEKSDSPSNSDTATDAEEDAWIRLGKCDYVCQECHRHNKGLLKHYESPGNVNAHFQYECEYGSSSITQSTPTSTPPTSPSESQSSTASSVFNPNWLLPRWQSQSTRLSWLGLRPNRFVCKECFRHDEQDLAFYETSGLASEHFQTECQYGPSFIAKLSNSPLILPSKWEHQTFDFSDHDSLTDLQFRRKFCCERSEYPVAIELENEEYNGLSRRRRSRPQWTCRHCMENGVPLAIWAKEGNVLNHWKERCCYNPRGKLGYSKGEESASQVFPALGYANL